MWRWQQSQATRQQHSTESEAKLKMATVSRQHAVNWLRQDRAVAAHKIAAADGSDTKSCRGVGTGNSKVATGEKLTGTIYQRRQ